MIAEWRELDAELALWRRGGLTLPLWWRDDDAVAPSPALERLSVLSRALDMPVHLAVIPARADPALARHVAQHPQLIPLVHGWAHENHAPAGDKKAEFGAHRLAGLALEDAASGLRRLRDLFGPALRPVFVPPWNRIAGDVTVGLPALGFRVLSTARPRPLPEAAPGLAQVNTHLDPIDWHGTRGLLPAESLIAQLTADLRDRRTGRTDPDEPYGLLTHHLVHDEDIWAFSRAVLTRLLDGPARPWTAPTED
ncbi:hypothetical protein SAMN05444007_10243 [Cribrihabitans marinus]|uniref:Polysaccharide deacetylase n=1 Tax=Cribrihabitans marinus TaxID=1227549 RepID=A0A1H6SL19_9RHOB|nr:polysaccharide deacetylase family protein [Cribrihabitans marinus]GGH23743.1 polysaccharide deacetylase [Cribrihabitans marinus]SEI64670.1 hypothetical protein SAMN05444007_10243 [Cribrihabitans marinus]